MSVQDLEATLMRISHLAKYRLVAITRPAPDALVLDFLPPEGSKGPTVRVGFEKLLLEDFPVERTPRPGAPLVIARARIVDDARVQELGRRAGCASVGLILLVADPGDEILFVGRRMGLAVTG